MFEKKKLSQKIEENQDLKFKDLFYFANYLLNVSNSLLNSSDEKKTHLQTKHQINIMLNQTSNQHYVKNYWMKRIRSSGSGDFFPEGGGAYP